MQPDHPLQKELALYAKKQAEFEKHHDGKFVLIHDEDFIGAFDTFDNAAKEAIKLFGDGPYLIRQVGMDYSIKMPASVAFRPIHAAN